jgi:DNA-binding transcriptional LysR family regulator
MINVRYLMVFRAVMKTGSVAEAGRILGISQPAVTKTLRLIAHQIGVPLFATIRGRLHLTPEAELLFPQVERLLGDVASVEHLAEEIAEGYAGGVTLASVSTLAAALIPQTVERFRRTRPKVRVQINALPISAVTEMVSNNQADLGLVHHPLGDPDLKAIDLCESEVICALPQGHRLADKEVVTPADLVGETLISYSDQTSIGTLLRDSFRFHNAACRISTVVNFTYFACTLVRSGAGIALIDPFPIVSGAFPDLVVRPFRPAVLLRPRLMLLGSRPVSHLTRQFIDEILKSAAELVALGPQFLRLPGDPGSR